MTTFGNIFFWGTLGFLVLLAVMAVIVGWWVYAIVAVVVGACLVFTGPWVLGRKWRPLPPRPTRRPVVRRRR